jgi:biopolymer transport protein ExbD
MAGGGGGDEFGVSINLTALLDVLTNLLFFLMFGYAAQQYSMEAKAGVRLPEGTAEVAPKKDLEVIISINDIRVEDTIIAKIKDGKIDGPLTPTGRIGPLTQRMTTIKERRPANLPDADVLLILADKETPYALLRKVMNSCAEAGFIKFRMGVLMQ